nr:uncharacterized protein LOC124810142 isoform X2 [Hydra vulgaris]
MRILCNIQIKTSIGISFKNPYIFASGKKSESHCSGWHAMTSVCEDLPLENKKQLNATTNRHRISTLMASISMTDSERNLFYDHMGHSEAINKHIYQAPPAIMQLSNTGLRLTCIDKGQPCETPAKMAKKYHTEPIYNYENHYKDAFSYESDSSRCDATKGKDSQFSTSAQTAEEELMQPSSSFDPQFLTSAQTEEKDLVQHSTSFLKKKIDCIVAGHLSMKLCLLNGLKIT